MTQAICGMPAADIFAWLKKMRPKCSRSGNTSVWCGRLAPPESTDRCRAAGFDRDLLRAEMLLHRHRIVGAALYRRIVADHHDEPPRDAANSCNDAGAMDRFSIHAVSGERRKFQKRRGGVDQVRDTLARQELSARAMALARPLRPAPRGLGAERAVFGDQPRPGLRVVWRRSRVERLCAESSPIFPRGH